MNSEQEPEDHSDEDSQVLEALATWLRSEPERWPMLDDEPISDERMAELTELIIAEHLRPAEPVSIDEQRSALRRRVRRRVTMVAMPVVAVVLAAAGWAILRDGATEAMSFACAGPGVTAIVPNDGTPPIDSCQDLWESGGLAPGVTSAPPLAACVAEGMTVMVVEAEGDDGCAGVDGEPWADQPEYEAIGRAITAVRADLHDRYQRTGDGCATEDDWTSGLAARPEADGWTVEVEQTDPDHRCFDVSEADPTTRRIVLLSSAGDHSIGCDPRTGC